MHDFEKVSRALDGARGSLVYLLHANADPDCVGAAFALRDAFGGDAWAVKGVSLAGRKLANRVGLEIFETIPDPASYALRVVVDTGSSVQLGTARDWVLATDLPFAIVDHHAAGDVGQNATFNALDASRSSASEVALALIEAGGRAPSEEASLALLAGLVSDTGRLRFADARALVDAARLMALAHVERVEDVYPLIGDDDDEDAANERSRRIAHLKAAGRLEVSLIDEFVIATSTVKSHEASAALAFTRLGADVAFVAAVREDGVRVSARARREIAARGLNLGGIMREVAEAAGCGGGGHPASAGMSGAPSVEAVMPALVKALERGLRRLERRAPGVTTRGG